MVVHNNWSLICIRWVLIKFFMNYYMECNDFLWILWLCLLFRHQMWLCLSTCKTKVVNIFAYRMQSQPYWHAAPKMLERGCDFFFPELIQDSGFFNLKMWPTWIMQIHHLCVCVWGVGGGLHELRETWLNNLALSLCISNGSKKKTKNAIVAVAVKAICKFQKRHMQALMKLWRLTRHKNTLKSLH